MLRNILSNWSNFILSALSVFLLYPFCVRVLGEEQYGIWLIISSITGYFALLQLGVPMANVRFVAKYQSAGEIEKVNEVVSSNFAIFSVIGIVVLIAGSIVAFLLESLFHVPDRYLRLAQTATMIVSLNISLSFTFEVFEGVLHALEQFVFLNVVKNLLLLARVILTFLTLKYDYGLVALGALLLMVTVLQAACFFVFLRKRFPAIKIDRKYIHPDVFKKIAGYSVFVLISTLAGKVSFNTDAIVIGSVVSLSAVVFFAVGNNFMLYFMNLSSGIHLVLMPMVSKLDEPKDNPSLKEAYLVHSRLATFFAVPICLFFILYGGDFIAIWMGEKFRAVSGGILTILTISYFFLFVQNSVAYPILMGTSRLRYPTFFMLSTAVLNLVLSIWWGRAYGLYGVAWGTTIPNLINVAGTVSYMCSTYRLSLFHYLARGIVIPMSAGVFFMLPALAMREWIGVDSLLKFIFSAGLSAAIYCICLFSIYFDKKTRQLVLP